MEEYVKDCLLTNEYSDYVLLRMVELTASSIRSDRPLFPSLLDEPVFYRRHFHHWISEAMEERRAMTEAAEEQKPY
jgi:hypothetical protein